jgi:hypothetical protein
MADRVCGAYDLRRKDGRVSGRGNCLAGLGAYRGTSKVTMQEDAITTLQAFIDRHGGTNREAYEALIEIAAKAIYWAAGIRQDCEPDQSVCELCLASREAAARAHNLRDGADGDQNSDRELAGHAADGTEPAIADDVPPAKDPAKSPWRLW